jgi:hypothetical protein
MAQRFRMEIDISSQVRRPLRNRPDVENPRRIDIRSPESDTLRHKQRFFFALDRQPAAGLRGDVVARHA